ncbi:prephenate dehydrogenase [Flavobacteriaceae bacterium]|jgi:prephenate dehydrogenase|nr:prephenate dehydrogenase [Flavobacteriaceae bacterium]MCP4803613.1 prephenate dehydrogenase [Bacteroidota bacterium]MDA9551433.1 prephenate dehydrogenase [Flavobacteriaceae bacterium]MDC0957147.1 prephenate dehydrogenase [Flavobacteriaceae bacterium]MDC3242595.1 prephenate dehydrogenase [Flavobacteriaceae bacterium]|tara:strand:- start:25693 stop:26544 length:852 start_codon:yes stop_codon:yes gene_type:complete
MKNIYIIGVGLIGGSFALDIRQLYPNANIFGIDHSELNLTKASALGIINDVATVNDLSHADLVVVAIPVNVIVEQLPIILSNISDNTLVIDAGSTKEAICQAVKNHPRRRNFLATHPIAGTEFSGPSSAIHSLYKGQTNIICQVEETAFKLQEKALKLFDGMGMRIRYMKPKAHDQHIAYVSHLSHISSFMLGKTVIEKEKNERDIFDMAGSGFESTVRLAKSSPEMWTPIFRQNKINILKTLEEYIANLSQFKHHIENDDFDSIYQEMKSTNHIKEILKGIA